MFHVLSNNANTREKWRVYPSVGHLVLDVSKKKKKKGERWPRSFNIGIKVRPKIELEL